MILLLLYGKMMHYWDELGEFLVVHVENVTAKLRNNMLIEA